MIHNLQSVCYRLYKQTSTRICKSTYTLPYIHVHTNAVSGMHKIGSQHGLNSWRKKKEVINTSEYYISDCIWIPAFTLAVQNNHFQRWIKVVIDKKERNRNMDNKFPYYFLFKYAKIVACAFQPLLDMHVFFSQCNTIGICSQRCLSRTHITSVGWQDLVTQYLVKITFWYNLVATCRKLDFVLYKLEISIWKDRATVAW